MPENKHLTVSMAGYDPVGGIPKEDYRDFERVRMSIPEVRHCLNAGFFPPGLILFDGQTRAKVIGPYLKPQSLMRVKA